MVRKGSVSSDNFVGVFQNQEKRYFCDQTFLELNWIFIYMTPSISKPKTRSSISMLYEGDAEGHVYFSSSLSYDWGAQKSNTWEKKNSHKKWVFSDSAIILKTTAFRLKGGRAETVIRLSRSLCLRNLSNSDWLSLSKLHCWLLKNGCHQSWKCLNRSKSHQCLQRMVCLCCWIQAVRYEFSFNEYFVCDMWCQREAKGLTIQSCR